MKKKFLLAVLLLQTIICFAQFSYKDSIKLYIKNYISTHEVIKGEDKKRLQFFDKDVIQWKKHCDLHDFYSVLLHLNYSNPALNAQSDVFQLHTNYDINLLSYLRKKDGHEVIVFLNLSGNNFRFELLDKWISGTFREAFLHYQNDFSINRSFEIKAWQWLVWVKE